ncbi:MAG: glycine cleavage system aminomethyltransferase GcvT [Myxococcales bacterium]|nr:glycine cleavage system aminomethyltransferase GcvT [Myxococcales bacterium]MCB9643522.1 glycine cleavage system aminomethyltransferase GcvT [Myxococcales bacterium]
MTEQKPRRTPLYEKHVAHKARIVDFAGWEMPIQYEGIVAEHNAVREKAGLFDVSHMGRVELFGKGALPAIQHWITNDASRLQDNQALYTPICYPEGGVVDDCLVYRLKEEHFIIVINASNRDKDFAWFQANIPAEAKADLEMKTPEDGDKWALLAIQGPQARTMLNELADADLMPLKHNQLSHTTIAGIADCMAACTGYTGEDGFEIFVPTAQATALWDALINQGAVPIGLGARDTLRMEMRYPLYGNDIDQTTTPIEAGLNWTVKPDKGDFIGRDVLVEQIQNKPPRRLVGLLLKERGVPRHGYKIFDAAGEQEIGILTSGGFAPSLQQSIGIGYVPANPAYAKIGSALTIEIRNKKIAAEVVKTPFFNKTKA